MSLSPKVMARNWRKNNIRSYIKFLSVQKKSKTGKLTAMWAMTRTQSVTHWQMSTRSLQLQLKLQLELEGQVLKSDNASHCQWEVQAAECQCGDPVHYLYTKLPLL